VVGESNDGGVGATVCLEGVVGLEPAHPVGRDVGQVAEPLPLEPRGEQGGVGAGLHDRAEVAVVVDVVVAQEDPTNVLGFDDRPHVAEVLLAQRWDAGVDDDRLAATDDHGVEVDGNFVTLRCLHHEGVGGDLDG
jgi:hypothetical protein